MKKIAFLSCIAFVLFSFTSAVQTKFPNMTCQDIEGKSINLPADVSGKYTILGFAYSQKAEKALNTWYKPLYQKFIMVPDPKPMMWEPYDVNLYFIPMFSGLKKAAAGQFKKEVKEKVDPNLQGNILLFKGKIKEYKKQLNMKDKTKPYFFLLDKDGKIIYRTEGAFSKAKLTKLEQQIDDF